MVEFDWNSDVSSELEVFARFVEYWREDLNLNRLRLSVLPEEVPDPLRVFYQLFGAGLEKLMPILTVVPPERLQATKFGLLFMEDQARGTVWTVTGAEQDPAVFRIRRIWTSTPTIEQEPESLKGLLVQAGLFGCLISAPRLFSSSIPSSHVESALSLFRKIPLKPFSYPGPSTEFYYAEDVLAAFNYGASEAELMCAVRSAEHLGFLDRIPHTNWDDISGK